MIILNFSHPLTSDHLAQIEGLVEEHIDEVRDVTAQLDHQQPFVPQVEALANACRLTPQEWQTASLLVVPPALNFITAALLAELHGRMGYFPDCLRLRPMANVRPPRYEVAEILDLQAVRDAARGKRR